MSEPSDPRVAVKSANQRVKELHERGNNQAALDLATQTLELARQQLGEAHPLYVVSLGNLAVIWKWLGFTDNAKRAYEQILSWHRASGTDHGEWYLGTLGGRHPTCGGARTPRIGPGYPRGRTSR
jgi:hypothetical protein